MSRLTSTLAAAALTVCGCAPVYVAPAAHAPLFGKGGELHAGGHTGTNGLDVQAAYSPIDSLGVLADLSAEPDSNGDRHVSGQAGAGYYLTFASVGRVEAYATLGGGSSHGQYALTSSSTPSVYEGSYLRGTAQLNLGFSTDFVDLALVNRLALVRYSYSRHPESTPQADNVFWEPIGLVRLGYKFIKFEWQVGFSFPLTNDEPQGTLVHISLGLHLKFDLMPSRESPPPVAPPPPAPPPAQYPPPAYIAPPPPPPPPAPAPHG